MSNEAKALLVAFLSILIICLCCACGYDVLKGFM